MLKADALLSWIGRPSTDRGIRFAAAGEQWEFHSYAALATLVRRACHGLVSADVRRNDVVLIVARTSPALVAALFGTMLAGATPAMVAPPAAFQDQDTYPDHLAAVCAATRPVLVVTERELLPAVKTIAAATGRGSVVAIEDLLDAAAPEAAARAPAELALIQFTSGSSGRPRGLRVPYAAISANIAAIRRWLAMTPDDPTACWLPLHHDMGLIGCLLTPVTTQADLWVMQPADFIRKPLRYLRCFGAQGARLTAMPAFGLEHIVRRLRPAQLEGLDFGQWRAVIVGAERIDPKVLERFCALLAPYGLAPEALLPAYGLAEATLAVTGLSPAERWRAIPVAQDSLLDTTGVVGCGGALDGVSITIVDERGPVPDGTVGEIAVRSPALTSGYLPGAEVGAGTRLAGGELHTGDAGFLRDGQLYVLGRMGDSVKVRGRAVFAEDVEAALVRVGIPASRVTAALGIHLGEPTVVAVVEHAAEKWLLPARSVLRAHGAGAKVVLLSVPRGSVPRTSSGKPRRRLVWRAYCNGELPGPVRCS